MLLLWSSILLQSHMQIRTYSSDTVWKLEPDESSISFLRSYNQNIQKEQDACMFYVWGKKKVSHKIHLKCSFPLASNNLLSYIDSSHVLVRVEGYYKWLSDVCFISFRWMLPKKKKIDKNDNRNCQVVLVSIAHYNFEAPGFLGQKCLFLYNNIYVQQKNEERHWNYFHSLSYLTT